jgi:hypothetical protein
MAELLSAQYTKHDATPRVMVDPTDATGRVRVARFSWTALAPAQNDTVKMCRLPKGARLITGHFAFGAHGGSVTFDIGITGDTDKYASAVDISSAGESSFLNTQALNTHQKLTAETPVLGLWEGANPTDSIEVEGYILYVVD